MADTAISLGLELLKFLYGLRETQKDNSAQKEFLSSFVEQTEAQVNTLKSLESKLKHRRSCEGVPELLGKVAEEYQSLKTWLDEFARKIDAPVWSLFRAPIYQKKLQDRKDKIQTAFTYYLNIINTLLGAANLEEQVVGNSTVVLNLSEVSDDVRELKSYLRIQGELIKKLTTQATPQHGSQLQDLGEKVLNRTEDVAQMRATFIAAKDLIVHESEVLGTGNHGRVLAATLNFSGTLLEVAVRELVCFQPTKDQEKHFNQEVEKIKLANLRCSSAYVCRFFGVCQKDNRHFLVMKRYTTSLKQKLKSGGRLSTHEGCDIARKVALGLREMQVAKFVHLDVKPGNILLDAADNAVLSDFSYTHYFPDGQGSTFLPSNPNVAVGTWQYMPPECAIREKTDGIKYSADVWSLAATLLHMLTGEPPYPGLADPALCMKLLKKIPPELPKDQPEALLQLLRDCFSFEPSQRPALPTIIRVLTEVIDSSNGAPAPREPQRLVASTQQPVPLY